MAGVIRGFLVHPKGWTLDPGKPLHFPRPPNELRELAFKTNHGHKGHHSKPPLELLADSSP